MTSSCSGHRDRAYPWFKARTIDRSAPKDEHPSTHNLRNDLGSLNSSRQPNGQSKSASAIRATRKPSPSADSNESRETERTWLAAPWAGDFHLILTSTGLVKLAWGDSYEVARGTSAKSEAPGVDAQSS